MILDDSIVLVLPDGRQLGYVERGDPDGFPVLFCHSAPGSRWQVSPSMANAAEKRDIRLITADRPGYGLSDPQTNRTLLDWPKDAAVLMDSLDIKQFGVIGFSMGGAYALACAHALPQRVTHVTVASSLAPNVFDPQVMTIMPPSSAGTYLLARDNPDALYQVLAPLLHAPEQLLDMFTVALPASDKAVFCRPEVEAGFRRDCVESLCHEGKGMARDFMLVAGDWGFSLEAIAIPVDLWQGEEDINAPLPMAEYLCAGLPRCITHLLPADGHLCLFEHWQEMLDGFHARD